MQEGIPIRKIGTYFEVDEEGYIINPCSIEKIQEVWNPVIADVIASYREHCGDTLHSVYVRGSVAKGTAIENVSDLDSFSYVNIPREDISYDWLREAEREIADRYPFAEGVEMNMDSVQNVETNRIMLQQSICVYGPDLSKDLPKLKPGKDMIVHAFTLDQRMDWLKSKLDTLEGADLQDKCVWLMKGFLRTGFELTMDRSKTYTRDLYPCYETFSKYYPEKEPEMREALMLALNPTDDKEKLVRLMEGLGTWLEHEAKIIYPSDE